MKHTVQSGVWMMRDACPKPGSLCVLSQASLLLLPGGHVMSSFPHEIHHDTQFHHILKSNEIKQLKLWSWSLYKSFFYLFVIDFIVSHWQKVHTPMHAAEEREKVVAVIRCFWCIFSKFKVYTIYRNVCEFFFASDSNNKTIEIKNFTKMFSSPQNY